MKPLTKAVFPVAGLGTRFLPATKTIPKEMLPVVDRPLIQYAVNEAVEAGCDTLIFVTGRTKRAVEDYFDRNPELEAELEASKKAEALRLVRDIVPDHVRRIFVRQEAPLGLGHAVLCAAPLIAPDEPFAVILPDDLIDGIPTAALSQLRDTHEALNGASVLAVEHVPRKNVSSYGIVKPKTEAEANVFEIESIIEKPSPEDAPSQWAVVGRYILSGRIMEILPKITRGRNNELQLTDAIAQLLQESPVHACAFHGKRFDCGSKKGFLQANIYFGINSENDRS